MLARRFVNSAFSRGTWNRIPLDGIFCRNTHSTPSLGIIGATLLAKHCLRRGFVEVPGVHPPPY